VNENGLDIRDATDGSNDHYLVGDFPLGSGVGEIVFPAEQLLFAADGMLPANVAAGEESEVFDLQFSRGDDTGGSVVLVESMTFEVLDQYDRVVDPSGVIETVSFEDGSGEIPTTFVLQGGSIQVDLTNTLTLSIGESIDILMHVMTVERPDVDAFSVRINTSSHISCRDGTTGEPVAVYPTDGEEFPFNSGRAAILLQNVKEAFSNYPNPFIVGRENTRITFYMPSDGRVTLKLFTITGRPVKTLLENEVRSAGLHQDIYWDGTNGRGETVLNGVYYLMLKVHVAGKEEVLKRKVAVVR